MTTVIRNKRAGRVKDKDKGLTYKELSDEKKFLVLSLYAKGAHYREIGKAVGISGDVVSSAVSILIKELTIVQESNKLSGPGLTLPTPTKNSTEITKEFIEDVKDNGMTYASFMGITNDSKYSLRAAGLDKMPKGIQASTRQFIIRMRSQYLRSIPEIRAEIEVVRREELKNAGISKPYVVTEIISLLEQEKIRSSDEPSARKNCIALIKMLGDTQGSFTTNIKIEEVDSSKSLELLIEMAQEEVTKEVVVSGTYTVEDSQ